MTRLSLESYNKQPPQAYTVFFSVWFVVKAKVLREGETLQRPAVIAAVSGGDNDNRRTIIKKVNMVKTFLIRISSLIMKVLTVTDCISTSSYDKIRLSSVIPLSLSASRPQSIHSTFDCLPKLWQKSKNTNWRRYGNFVFTVRNELNEIIFELFPAQVFNLPQSLSKILRSEMHCKADTEISLHSSSSHNNLARRTEHGTYFTQKLS